MSSLMERQPKNIFSFPGLMDRGVKKEVIIEPIVEEKKEDVVTKPKGKGGRPKKVVVEESEAPKTTKKALSLTGKIY